MNLYAMLQARAEQGMPLRVGLIGAGKFGAMFLSQALHTPGLHILAIADLDVGRAREQLATTGWPPERYGATSPAKALADGSTYLTDDADELIRAGGIEVVIEATGVPEAGIAHALKCFERGRHVIMVNVEADALAGPLLARRAAQANVVYSMAYGDQPALIAEQVDWARACGFQVIAAGKGTKYLPQYHASTPETVWDYYGLTSKQAAAAGMNAKMFNSFLDGTKSAIEMAAVANACDLTPPDDGLQFPPCGIDDLAQVLRPQADGGVLPEKGMVEVISSLHRDGREVERDLRWGVFVSFEAPSDYVRDCFAQYGVTTDDSGRYCALYRPFHLIGLELGISVIAAGLTGQPTGVAQHFRGDVVATAKRGLESGEVLDGEGGFTVYGTLMGAAKSCHNGYLPIGLASGVTLKTHIANGQAIKFSDVEIDETTMAFQFRRQMEATFDPVGGLI
ncbi:MAG: flagellar biosynthesis protein FlgA [Rhodospirillaceae bacterium]|nr:flagellar biosynthesis protein FlgA [Rhodospirillaceae bacterium]MBL6930119.1 flagellar biosynthesis protein FlgA [Rhodospirillales bacterium]MBL6940895.1 flagellar biosynthesis protein FlgA [Rhodospirillales bacterium]